MKKYTYDGPVMAFGRSIENNWKATTYAETERKARSNIAFQFKRLHGKSANSIITLPGKLTVGM